MTQWRTDHQWKCLCSFSWHSFFSSADIQDGCSKNSRVTILNQLKVKMNTEHVGHRRREKKCMQDPGDRPSNLNWTDVGLANRCCMLKWTRYEKEKLDMNKWTLLLGPAIIIIRVPAAPMYSFIWSPMQHCDYCMILVIITMVMMLMLIIIISTAPEMEWNFQRSAILWLKIHKPRKRRDKNVKKESMIYNSGNTKKTTTKKRQRGAWNPQHADVAVNPTDCNWTGRSHLKHQ